MPSIEYFLRHRSLNEEKAAALEVHSRAKDAFDLRRCASFLQQDQNLATKGEYLNASRCRHIGCTECAKSKKARIGAHFDVWFPELIKAMPDLEFSWITIGLPICSVNQITECLGIIQVALKRLRSRLKPKGVFAAREFPFANDIAGYVHPNLHLIVAGPSKRGLDIQLEILNCFDFDLSEAAVSVEDLSHSDLKQKLMYSSKGSDYFEYPNSAADVLDQLKKRRLLTFSGVFRNFKKQFKLEKFEDRDFEVFRWKGERLEKLQPINQT